MNLEEYRVIPGYAGYGVTRDGKIKSLARDLVLRQYVFNGYLIVDAFRGSLTETLPVHRAVALAWVENRKPSEYNVVNHKDGIPLNNWFENLEWTNCSGNNYHAIETGLRSDNMTCQVRDFYTKQVHDFSSMAQAAEFMGLRKDSSFYSLKPKKFGALVADRYEFRFSDDVTPWFYEERSERVPPARFMVVVTDSDNQVTEIYSTSTMLKKYQLYGSLEKGIPALAAYATEIHPDKVFVVRDSYAEPQFRPRRQKLSYPLAVYATHASEGTIDFPSLTKCAERFNVDRSSILGRLNNGRALDGWTFSQMPRQSETTSEIFLN